MRTELIKQFNSIRDTLSTNVDTIGRLVEQANTLSVMAGDLNGAGEANQELKERLKVEINRIQNSIAELIKQTDKLFELYNEFAETIFHSKS